LGNKLTIIQDQKQKEMDLLTSQMNKELENTELNEQEKENIRERYRILKAEKDAEYIEKEKTEKQKQRDLDLQYANEAFNTASTLTSAIGSLSDLSFSIKSKNLKKGSEEEKRAAEKAFEMNKKIQIAGAVISGIQGVINALTAKSILPEPFASVQRGINAVAIAASTAANIAKISSTKFDSGGSATPNIPSPPPEKTPNIPVPNANSTIGLGAETIRTSRGELKYQKVYVTETDIKTVMNRVDVIESRSKIR